MVTLREPQIEDTDARGVMDESLPIFGAGIVREDLAKVNDDVSDCD